MSHPTSPNSGYFTEADCNLAAFAQLTSQITDPASLPHAADVQKNIPIYDMAAHHPTLRSPSKRRALMAEWGQVLLSGAGIIVLKNAYTETDVLDQATVIYNRIIAQESEANGGGGDHFAASGANDRVWNALQKLCLSDPKVFLAYFANPAIATACEAWLGPNYQVTAQVNQVHPGGQAQQAHRDYHLGFQSPEVCALYPAHQHDLSAALTLQGAIAHCDMPVESGPTKLLPFSQQYRAGYAAWRRPDFRAYFEDNHVQLPLSKGDALFFNPAVFHAAGANTTSDVHRMANLLQISSAFGRATEAVDRAAMCKALYPHIQAAGLPQSARDAAIAATAEGYSFPTNLDSDPPIGGLAPETQAQLFHRALKTNMAVQEFTAEIDTNIAKRRP